jgi:hypothetical protein
MCVCVSECACVCVLDYFNIIPTVRHILITLFTSVVPTLYFWSLCTVAYKFGKYGDKSSYTDGGGSTFLQNVGNDTF